MELQFRPATEADVVSVRAANGKSKYDPLVEALQKGPQVVVADPRTQITLANSLNYIMRTRALGHVAINRLDPEHVRVELRK